MPSGLEFRKYKFRTVYGLEQLREKISIFEFGLNDIAVERMKFFIRLGDDNVLPQNKLIFLKVDTNPKEMKSFGFELGVIKFVYLREGKSPRIIPFSMEQYFDYMLAVDMDPRMRVDYCTCVDEGWMMMKLQNL